MKPGIYCNGLKMCELMNFSHNDLVIAFYDEFLKLVVVHYIDQEVFKKSPYKFLGAI